MLANLSHCAATLTGGAAHKSSLRRLWALPESIRSLRRRSCRNFISPSPNLSFPLPLSRSHSLSCCIVSFSQLIVSCRNWLENIRRRRVEWFAIFILFQIGVLFATLMFLYLLLLLLLLLLELSEIGQSIRLSAFVEHWVSQQLIERHWSAKILWKLFIVQWLNSIWRAKCLTQLFGQH